MKKLWNWLEARMWLVTAAIFGLAAISTALLWWNGNTQVSRSTLFWAELMVVVCALGAYMEEKLGKVRQTVIEAQRDLIDALESEQSTQDKA